MPWKRLFRRRRKSAEIAPDEIFIDSTNLPSFDTDQFEGRIEKPISQRTLVLFFSVFILLAFVVVGRAGYLQGMQGEAYAALSEANRLSHEYVFADRGTIVDRRGTELAYDSHDTESDFPRRVYAPYRGLAHVLGYAKAPAKDSAGYYYQDSYVGAEGLERTLNERLQGVNGLKIKETDATGNEVSESTIAAPKHGERIVLSIDADLTQEFYDAIASRAQESGFRGGAGAMIDLTNGEVLALTSYPSFDSQVMVDRTDKETIRNYFSDTRQPFLNRATLGLFTPGSIMKPFFALGALHEHTIDPAKQILSTGALTVPNPYDPEHPSVFRDWKAHGWVDMRHAISVSSNVYFFVVGGGFEGQRGLGIDNLDKYAGLFRIGSPTGIGTFSEAEGTIPSPQWKASVFPDDPWRLGDTYNSSIGQYGWQVTPLQMLRAVGAIATNGALVTPTILKGEGSAPQQALPFSSDEYAVVHDGMRLAAIEGTAKALNVDYVKYGAKTGTAELDSAKKYVNSWVMGYFPYEKPRYAFIILLEHGPYKNLYGSAGVMRVVSDWMYTNRPEYLRGE